MYADVAPYISLSLDIIKQNFDRKINNFHLKWNEEDFIL